MNLSQDGKTQLVRLIKSPVDKTAGKLIAQEFALSFMVAPLRLEGNDLVVACTDPSDKGLINEIELTTRRKVIPQKASYSEIRNLLDTLYGGKPASQEQLEFNEILFRLGYLTPENLKKLQSIKETSDKTAHQICRENSFSSEENLIEAAGVYYSVPHINVFNKSSDLSILIPWEIATNQKIIPLFWLSDMLIIATPEPKVDDQLDELSNFLGVPFQQVLCTYPEWNLLYRRFYLRGMPDKAQKDLEIVTWLINHNEITGLDMNAVRDITLQNEQALDTVLIRRGICTRSQWMYALSKISGMELLSLRKEYLEILTKQPELSDLIPETIAKRFSILPVKKEDTRLVIAISEPDHHIINLVEGITGLSVQAFLHPVEDIQNQLIYLYGEKPSKVFPNISGLSDLLRKSKIVTNDQLIEIESDQRTPQLSFEQKLIKAGYISEFDLIEALSLLTGIPFICLDYTHFQKPVVTQLPATIAIDHSIIPIWSTSTEMWVATSDPFDSKGLKDAESATKKRIHPILTSRSTILVSLERLLGVKGKKAYDPKALNMLRKLVEAGLLTQNGATLALQEYYEANVPLDRAIVDASDHPPIDIARAIAKEIKLHFADLRLEDQTVTSVDPMGQFYEKEIVREPIDQQAAHIISLEDAQRLSVIPIGQKGNQLTIAFADPNYKQCLKDVQAILSEYEIIPVYASRADLENAISRILGKRNIGDYLLLDGLVTRGQLNDALDFAQKTGVRIGKALVNRGFITESQLYLYLSKQTSLSFYDLKTVEIDEQLARTVPAKTAREFGFIPLRKNGDEIEIGIIDPFNNEAGDKIRELLGLKIKQALITEKDLEEALEDLFSQDYLAQSISELLERTPNDSAFKVLNMGQTIVLVLLLLISAIWLWIDFSSYIILINALATIFYITFSSYRFMLVYKALSHTMDVTVSAEDLHALDDRDLPIYTILVPVYKEAEILPGLLDALKKLDYPTTKLDIQILMEQDDVATIDAFNNWSPPSHFHGVVVPFGEPKTKPKACNYGLIHARGEYVVIFDAEDLPQPDQLKKIIVAFSKSAPDVVCIQSKLNYYNSEQNLLTRWFTIEYSMWFDLFLPGLSAASAPIPLGGTSNHFRRDALIEIGAWDPYNVTEDADLGVRLFKRGYKTAIVDSTTYEEANSQIRNWIRQRSRWIKGYIQTWLVHMRHPFQLIHEIGLKGFLSFQFVVGGTFFSALINPIYWALTTLWFLLEWQFIQVIFPGIVFIMGALCLFIGNFVFTYMNVAGAMRREQYSLVKVALISPVYWALASVAAWVGFIQLLYKPHFWEKTTHGLYTGTKEEEPGK